MTSIGSVIRRVSVDLLGDAEIGDFDRFVDRHEEIAGLNVFMNHILTVEILCKGKGGTVFNGAYIMQYVVCFYVAGTSS